ncbi:hypothetical protein OSH11_13895 [Kaistia dalseonensis]|uniref:Uncharacterized protein n=1 Tax=Kaistia dalseonensis TaxID=410840 RepID=A0ABU0H966_9HYPH|nr:hypothetical protein [Kaistia dalseonensis]MCX5495802.1 hypothetical protein [Kaistia dalseonensis]MDQ0438403.1 hypothetical protein [Kaistia dalseonensis]
MDAITTAIATILTSYGLSGVVIMALGYFAWNRSQRLDEVQDKRIAEGREALTAMKAAADSAAAVADGQEAVALGLERLKTAIDNQGRAQ